MGGCMTSQNQFRIENKVTEQRTVRYFHHDSSLVWSDLIANDHDQLTVFFKEMKAQVGKKLPWPMVSLLANFFYKDLSHQERRYINECKFFADQFSTLSHQEMVFLQVQTTLAHYFPGGCTTVAWYDEQEENMVCMRSLDWQGADTLAQTTRIFNVQNESGALVGKVAGIAGMVGVLTGVKKGFAIVGNYAPRALKKKFRECLRKNDASFLIRKLIEDESIETYEQAVDQVMHWDVGAPFFITLCGIKQGDACTIEFGGEGVPKLRPADSTGMLIQTNHYPEESDYADSNRELFQDDKYLSLKRWYCSDILGNSRKRLNMIKTGLIAAGSSGESIKEKMQNIFRDPPVLNYRSALWALMHPAEGAMEVISLVDNDTCQKTCTPWKKFFCREK